MMMCGMIDLNTANNDEDDATSSYGSPSSSLELSAAAATSASSTVCMELWHACAGPLISLPKKGSAVVYFPQGHVEHLPDRPAMAYDLPPHVFCRVLDVKLHVDAANDEVYAQVSLVPDQQIEQKWREGIVESEAEDEDPEGVGKTMTPHMFCKTLTASDTSTHGGFSVPRRAAEDCFPPLDYKQQRPSQEIVAKDLHGIEWKFRHIYRGQPRRHLLTTGWSAFVNKKKLVSGDAVLFLRGGDGELRLGIRRAAQVKLGATVLPPNSQQFNASSIVAVVNAISMRNAFNICYNPRARSSEIIVPYHKFSKSLSNSFSSGMRFRVRFETEDSSERRCSGLLVGVSDVDPVRWPGSKWKCLLVRWDDIEVNRLNRVSPWEIELFGSSVSGPNSFMLPGTKRSRVCFAGTKSDLPVSRDGNEVSDGGEPLRFQKVLQGQEVFGLSAPYSPGVVESSRQQHQTSMRCYPGLSSSRFHAFARSHPLEGNVLGDSSSFQFHKVLQGQESASILPTFRRGPVEAYQVQENNATNVIDGIRVPSHGNNWSNMTNIYNIQTPFVPAGSSPSSVLLMQHSSPPPSHLIHQNTQANSFRGEYENGRHRSTMGLEERNPMGFSRRPLPTQPFTRDDQNLVSMCKSSCRLFGFPLTEGKVATGKGEDPTASAFAYGHKSNFSPCNEDQMYPPPLMSKVKVSGCTKVSDVHAVRDRLLDIAL